MHKTGPYPPFLKGGAKKILGLVHNCLGKSSLSTFNYLTIYRRGSHTILIPLVHRTIRTIKMTFLVTFPGRNFQHNDFYPPGDPFFTFLDLNIMLENQISSKLHIS